MANKHFIEHKDGDKWLAPWGFIASREKALQFPTEQDAKQYLEDNPQLRVAGHTAVAREAPDITGRFGGSAETRYDPYGLHGRS